MLSKEEILMYVQQGQAPAGWQVLRAKISYLLKQIATYAVLALVFIGFGIYILSNTDFVFGPIGLIDINGSFQTWRYIDEAVVAIALLLFLWMVVKNLMDLMSAQNQVLVLLPEGFLLKKRNTEQCVDYAGVAGISTHAGRYGDVTVHIKAKDGNALYKVQLDGRYGNAKMLAAQMMNAQRQYAANQRANVG